MKRVKEAFFRENPVWAATEGCSGAKEFEGEDLGRRGRDEHHIVCLLTLFGVFFVC